MKCGPARRRCGRTTSWCIRARGGRSWNTATASSATCASTCSILSAGCSTWAGPSAFRRTAASWSTRRARPTFPTRKQRRSNFGDLDVVWQHRTWGTTPDPKYPWGLTFYGDKGTLKASVMGYDFIPQGEGDGGSQGCEVRAGRISRRQDRKRPGTARGAGHSASHAEFSGRHRSPLATRRRHRRRPHFDGELHPGEHGDAAWPHADLGRGQRPDHRRRRS